MKYLLLLASMAIATTGQFLLKKGVSLSHLTPSLSSITATLFSPYVFAGFFFYGLSSIVWLFVLQKFPLSVAYPALALTYIVVVFASGFLLNEPITITKVLGTLFILCGVFLLFR